MIQAAVREGGAAERRERFDRGALGERLEHRDPGKPHERFGVARLVVAGRVGPAIGQAVIDRFQAGRGHVPEPRRLHRRRLAGKHGQPVERRMARKIDQNVDAMVADQRGHVVVGHPDDAVPFARAAPQPRGEVVLPRIVRIADRFIRIRVMTGEHRRDRERHCVLAEIARHVADSQPPVRIARVVVRAPARLERRLQPCAVAPVLGENLGDRHVGQVVEAGEQVALCRQEICIDRQCRAAPLDGTRHVALHPISNGEIVRRACGAGSQLRTALEALDCVPDAALGEQREAAARQRPLVRRILRARALEQGERLGRAAACVEHRPEIRKEVGGARLERGRASERRLGVVEATLLLQHQPEVGVRIGEVGQGGDGGLETPARLVELSEREQREAEIVRVEGMVGLERERLAQRRRSVCVAPREPQRHAEVVVRIGLPRRALDGAPEGFDCVVQTPERLEREPEVIDRIGVVRLERYRRAESGSRGLGVAAVEKSLAQVHVRAGGLRRERGRPAKRRDGLVVPPHATERDAEVAVRVRVRRPLPDRPAEGLRRLVGPPTRAERDAEGVEVVGVSPVDRERPLRVFDRELRPVGPHGDQRQGLVRGGFTWIRGDDLREQPLRVLQLAARHARHRPAHQLAVICRGRPRPPHVLHHAPFANCCVKRANSSSFARAAPLLIVSNAVSTPSSKVAAFPAT